MPYIKQEKRREVEYQSRIPNLIHDSVDCSGDLNYVFCRIAMEYLAKKGKCYQTMNDIIGAFDNAKDEFRRRVQHPYENEKIAENGDVF